MKRNREYYSECYYSCVKGKKRQIKKLIKSNENLPFAKRSVAYWRHFRDMMIYWLDNTDYIDYETESVDDLEPGDWKSIIARESAYLKKRHYGFVNLELYY